MTAAEANRRYTAVAIVLHWLIAAFILFNLAVGWFMNSMPPSIKMIVFPLHVSAGMTVLVLSVLRLVWRLTHRPPPFIGDMGVLERTGAHLVHTSLYVLMIAMPLIGWGLLSAHVDQPAPGFPIWGGLFHLRPLAPFAAIGRQPGGAQALDDWHATFVTMHSTGGWIMIALLALHVAAALKHQFFDGHAELARIGVGKADTAPAH